MEPTANIPPRYSDIQLVEGRASYRITGALMNGHRVTLATINTDRYDQREIGLAIISALTRPTP